jgi:hypothetical protein
MLPPDEVEVDFRGGKPAISTVDDPGGSVG